MKKQKLWALEIARIIYKMNEIDFKAGFKALVKNTFFQLEYYN